MENKKRLENIFIVIIVGALVVGDVFFGYGYFAVSKELQSLRASQTQSELNVKVVNFTSTFIKKVLRADKEVDFETRLSLENQVRSINDPEIMSEWQNFVGSKTETEAQNSVKKLLEILITKIQK